jgi:hypothetical protein
MLPLTSDIARTSFMVNFTLLFEQSKLPPTDWGAPTKLVNWFLLQKKLYPTDLGAPTKLVNWLLSQEKSPPTD